MSVGGLNLKDRSWKEEEDLIREGFLEIGGDGEEGVKILGHSFEEQ
jgi:hypothetical protein